MDSGPSTQPPRWRSRLRWWHPILALLLAILLPIAIVLIRFVNDWDLIPVRERATELGIDLDPEVPTVDPVTDTWLTEFASLLQRHQPFNRSDFQYDLRLDLDLDEDVFYRHRHAPIASPVIAYIDKQDPNERERLWWLINQITERGDSIHLRLGRRQPEVGSLTSGCYWMQDQLLVAPATQLPLHVRRMLRFVDQTKGHDLLAILVNCSLAALTCSSITERLPALRLQPAAERRAIAALLEGIAATWNDRFRHVHEYTCIDAHQLLSEARLWPDWGGTKLRNPFGPDQDVWTWYSALGRQQFLLQQLDLADAVKRSADPLGELAAIGATTPRIDELTTIDKLLGPERILEGYSLPAYTMITENARRTWLKMKLLAAVLSDGPWPSDPYGTDDRALQRLIIDDRLLAAYSVGPDGVDHGGDPDEDLVIWLYGHRADDGTITWGQKTLPVIEVPFDETLLEAQDETAYP